MLKFNIKTKLTLGFLVIVLFFIVINISISYIESKSDERITNANKIITSSNKLTHKITHFFSLTKGYLLITKKDKLENYKSEWVHSQLEINAPLKQLREAEIDPYVLDLIELNIKNGRETANNLIDAHNLLQIAEEERRVELERDVQVNLINLDNIHEKTKEALHHLIQQSEESYAEAVDRNKKVKTVSYISLVIALIIALTISISIANSITAPLQDLESKAGEIGSGNLDVKFDIKSKDEIGELSMTFNKMIEDLKKSTINVRELDKRVKERTLELELRNEELEKFHRLTVERELKMIDLKKKIKELE